MNTKHHFTTFDVVKIIDIKMERLQDWLKRGYIKPTYQEPVGRGMKNYFDLLQLYVIKTFKHLVENGITRNEAASWTKEIHETVQMQLDAAKAKPDQDKAILDHLKALPAFIVISKGASLDGSLPGDSIYIVKDDLHSVTLNAALKYDAIHIINFSKIRSQVDARIEE